METQLKFKTNINCGGCVAAVTPHLQNAGGINNWHIDTANADKILTVNSSCITPDEVVAAVNKAGFAIEPVK